MIETIFYFPASLTFDEYTTKLNNGELADRTIVFADAQNAIYKGGKKYGGWSNQEFHEHMEEYENYDDSWINDEFNNIKQDILDSNGRIDNLNALITGINNRLNDDVNGIGKDIQDKIEDMFDDSDWIEEHFPQGVVDWDEGWNDQIEAYLRLVGYWDIDAYGNKTTKWSKLQQGVDNISASVNNLITDGNISNALQSSIVATVRDNVASLNLGTTYARTLDVDDVHEVIEWLYSGLKSQTDPDKTFAQLVSAASTTGGSNAIADIRTYIEKLKSGDYVAQTEIAAKVNDTISTMLLLSSDNNALAALAAKADANSDDISAILLGMTGSSSTADIQTRIGTVLSGFVSNSDINAAKSEIYSAISAKDNSDNFISLAALKTQVDTNTSNISLLSGNNNIASGLLAKSELAGAIVDIFAAQYDGNFGDASSVATAKANLILQVKNGLSTAKLTADHVDIDGYLTGGNADFVGDVQADSFITGNSQQKGISVMTGNFNSSNANTNKVYFANDSTQGAVTMWFYQDNTWKCINLSDNAVMSEVGVLDQDMVYFKPKTFHKLNQNVSESNINTVDEFNNNSATAKLYYNTITGRYYNSATTSDPALGTYYEINEITYDTSCSDLLGRYARIHTATLASSLNGSPEKWVFDLTSLDGYFVLDYRNDCAFSTYQNGGEIIKYIIENGDCKEVGRANSYWVIYSVNQTPVTDVTGQNVSIDNTLVKYTLGTGVRKNAFCKKENYRFEDNNTETVNGETLEVDYTLITLGGLCKITVGTPGNITNVTPVALDTALVNTPSGFYHEFINVPNKLLNWDNVDNAGIVIS